MKNYIIYIVLQLILLNSVVLNGLCQSIFVSGFIEDELSGERLIGATIYNPESKKGQITNLYGFFGMVIDSIPVDIQISYLGYYTKNININNNKLCSRK